MPAVEQLKPVPEAVLAKAVLNAAAELGLKQAELAAVLGMHRNPSLDPDSKQGELALMLVRVARALFALTGGDEDWIRHFMRTSNKVTGGVPAEQIKSVEGLVSVLQFVDAIRGKL